MLRNSLTVLFSAGTLLASSYSFAWGQNGHRIIGELAQTHLTESTKLALSPILEDDSLAEISTWADEMRSNPAPFWKKKAGRWHYINIKDPENMHKHVKHDLSSKEEVKHILDGIYFSINTLKSPTASIKEKRFALNFLVHLVGDAHQPFHAGRSEDRGGNLIEVSFFGKKSNLHKTWDTELVENQNLSFTEFTRFIQLSDDKKIQQLQQTQPVEWLLESNRIAEKIYDSNETEISYRYIYKYMPIVKQRLQKGGIRLAGVLNEIYDPNAQKLAKFDTLSK